MFDFTNLKNDLKTSVDWLINEFSVISTGRAHPGLVENVSIDSYGSRQPLKNIATITLEDARTIRISPWDKSSLNMIQKTIQDEGLPFSVMSDSNGVRVVIPQMTEENRKKVAKIVKEKHEEARVRVRMARQKTEKEIDEAKKNNELSEDTQKKAKEDMQKFIDSTNAELDKYLAEKEKEVLTI